MAVPFLVSLVDFMLSTDEEVKVEQEEDDEGCKETECKDINLVSSRLSDTGDFGETIFLSDKVNVCLSDHVLHSLAREQVNPEFTDLNALFFFNARLDGFPELLCRSIVIMQE